MKKLFLVLLFGIATQAITAQGIDRRAVVTRNNPHIESADTLSSFTVGNGHFAVTVDATGLQTYPKYYSNGVPLGTFSEWAWHSFPNTNKYKPEEVLKNHDFHRGHKEYYSSEFKGKGRLHNASNYLRANPQRLHLGCLGFDFGSKPDLKNVHQVLDLWTGKITSDFERDNYRYHVETVCEPHLDIISVKIQRKALSASRHSSKPIKLIFRFPYPTGKNSDDGCNWTYNPSHQHIRIIRTDIGSEVLKIQDDSTSYFVSTLCKDNEGRYRPYNGRIKGNEFTLTLPDSAEFSYRFSGIDDKDPVIHLTCFDDIEQSSANYWKDYWTKGGIVDFSRVKDPRARELERRTILSLYLLAVNNRQGFPPAETGLTYNSWFGKFHLEMIYWHQAWQALWGHSEDLEHTLDWYFHAEPMARSIAKRQGFKGVRWMKMTDPSAAEAPSNVGSYLIWQQPHIIYLAELLYRSARADKESGQAKAEIILNKYDSLIEETAEFMADFAEYDSTKNQYILSGYIPAQETLEADSVVNSPFELAYWLEGLKIAQEWRKRLGKEPVALWNDIIEKLAPLPSVPYAQGYVYTVAEGVPLIEQRAKQTDTPTGAERFASDHPMPLGALGMLPESRLFNDVDMSNTYTWIMRHWNWQKTWGWDYPMVAMCAVRLGRTEDAIHNLLLPVQKNTYLNNGHNWQSNRLRCYLPGNGGLLTTIALMCAGWDGCEGRNPGFPKGWDVRWEGLLPMP